jgi:hypothetical protein
MSAMAPNSYGSVLNTNPRALHTIGRHHGYCLTVRSSTPAGCYSTERSSVLAVRKTGSHSSSHCHHSTANSMAGCCYMPVHSSVSSRLRTPRYFQSLPTAAGPRARTVLLGRWRHSDGWTMRCRIPAAHGHDPWCCLAPTKSAIRCYPADSPRRCHSAHCHSWMHARGPWRFLAPTRSATHCYPADSPTHCHSAHCHSRMHAH